MSPSLETRVFFKRLPESLKKRSHIAKIRVISTKIIKGKRHTRAQVLLSIKGMKNKKIFTIVSDSFHSCNQDGWIKTGDEVYVAGKMNSKGIFEGNFKGFHPNL